VVQLQSRSPGCKFCAGDRPEGKKGEVEIGRSGRNGFRARKLERKMHQGDFIKEGRTLEGRPIRVGRSPQRRGGAETGRRPNRNFFGGPREENCGKMSPEGAKGGGERRNKLHEKKIRTAVSGRGGKTCLLSRRACLGVIEGVRF